MLTATGLGVVIPLLVLAGAGEPEPPGCAVSDSHGRCLVVAVDPGRPGRQTAADRKERPEQSEPDQSESEVERVETVEAYVPEPGGVGRVRPGTLAAEPAAGVPVDPVVIGEVLAQRAVEQLTLAPPVPLTSVDGSGYVGVPVWLWIEGDVESTGPVSATATAGAAQVTATGRLTAVEWSMGPPGAEVRCTGPGTAWTGQSGSSPDCGYTYELRSLPERTDGAGRWTVTATSVWTVTWTGVSGGVPVAGEETVRVSTETSLAVGEVQVLVGATR